MRIKTKCNRIRIQSLRVQSKQVMKFPEPRLQSKKKNHSRMGMEMMSIAIVLKNLKLLCQSLKMIHQSKRRQIIQRLKTYLLILEQQQMSIRRQGSPIWSFSRKSKDLVKTYIKSNSLRKRKRAMHLSNHNL